MKIGTLLQEYFQPIVSKAARSFIRPAKQQNEVGKSTTARRTVAWRGA